ncbi:MAG: MBL fold metallo-hydrolase, partial [Patescibacteria group bacterium]
MEITYLGHSSFKLRGKTVTVVTDPFDTIAVGIKLPKHTSADIVTVSHHHADHDQVQLV